MSDAPRAGLDRRDFVISTLAGAAASAALVAAATPAQAQASAPTASPATPGTRRTGDILQGKAVVSALDVADLEPGKKHRLYFQGVQMPTGQHWYVSVIVAKGARPGKRMVLVSGVHGDEMSSVRTVQKVMEDLDPAQMSGTVMAVLDVSRPALEGMQRRWPDFGRGAGLIDMNREWPGSETGATAASRHAALVFNRLLRPNADLAIDFHTGTTGLDAAAFNIADRSLPDVKTMAELYPVGQIWDNAAYPGVLHNALIDVGIPCFTPEIGAARALDPEKIALFVEGTRNVLKHYNIIPGPIGRTAADAGVYIGNSGFPVVATQGGFVEHLVRLDDVVTPGQTLSIQRDTFGETVAEYTCAVDGRVAALRSDATAEPGNVLAVVLFNHAPAEGQRAYPE